MDVAAPTPLLNLCPKIRMHWAVWLDQQWAEAEISQIQSIVYWGKPKLSFVFLEYIRL